jgi:hypothetical protein
MFTYWEWILGVCCAIYASKTLSTRQDMERKEDAKRGISHTNTTHNRNITIRSQEEIHAKQECTLAHTACNPGNGNQKYLA